jgi:HemY protein
MRWLIWILGLAALATGLTLIADINPGYVLIAMPGQRIELSLNFAVILLVLGFIATYLLLRLLFTTIGLPSRVAHFREVRRRDAAQQKMTEALREFFSGRYSRAEKSAMRAVELGAPEDVGVVVAAHAAHGLRAQDRRDGYLDRLAADPDKSDIVRAVSRAQMLLDDRRPEEALAALALLPSKHTAALRLELRARQRIGQWDLAPPLIDQLEKRGVFSADQADAERRHAWRQLLERRSGDAAGLKDLWKRLPERYRRETSIAIAAAAAFHEMGLCDEATGIIESSLETDWDSGLVTLYGECRSGNALRQIECAERWLREHRKDGALLLALGRLCAQQQLWGKAQSYFEASVAVEPTYSAHLELAQLHDRLERADDARTHYRASLALAVGQLKQAGGGRRRKLV